MRSLVACALIVLGVSAMAVDTGEEFADPTLQARYERLIHDLRCLVCQNESIADSNATLAADLRREVRGMLLAGKSDADILAFMTERYGDFVLFKPPFVTRTWLLWLAPGLLLVIGAWIAVRVVRTRAQIASSDRDDSDLDSERT